MDPGVNDIRGMSVSMVEVAVIVGEAVGEIVDVGDKNIGFSASRHPTSGAAPANSLIGWAGTNSPRFVVYCVTPLSMAGDSERSIRPLKSSSKVDHVPSGPGFGSASKSGSTPKMLPAP